MCGLSKRAETVTEPGLLAVGAAQTLSSLSRDTAPDRNAGRSRFHGHGQGDALIEDAGDERTLAEARAPRDGDGASVEDRAGLLEDVDDPADAPRPRREETRGAAAARDIVECALLVATRGPPFPTSMGL